MCRCSSCQGAEVVVGGIAVVAALDVAAAASVMGAALEVAAGLCTNLSFMVLSVAASAMRRRPSLPTRICEASIVSKHVVIGPEAHVHACEAQSACS